MVLKCDPKHGKDEVISLVVSYIFRAEFMKNNWACQLYKVVNCV
jgi:hypothetical protein